MRRISVVGNSGSGKSTLARAIAERLEVPHVELDAIHHLAGWVPIDAGRFHDAVAEIASGDGWVIDGNYRAVVVDGPVWERADTVVWLDRPRRVVMRRLAWRTVRRAVRREELWNGNRESGRDLWSWDPERNILRWAWTQHGEYRDRYGAATTDPRRAHLAFVRLTDDDAVTAWLDSLQPDG